MQIEGTHRADIRMATEADVDLPTYDHTKLSALNTCPTWGILRYQMHKAMPGRGRALALEAGHAMHEVFALVRLATLMSQLEDGGKDRTFLDQLYNYHGTRLFGLERMEFLTDAIKDAEDVVDVCKRGAISLLDTSGFYDDPRDKRRTLSNMEECAYAYINRWRWDHPVWVRNRDDPVGDIGVEIPFDLVVTISSDPPLSFRFTGRIDGIHYDTLNRLTVHDNKTASRLGDAWTMAQEVSHQYTGYCVAASVFTQQLVARCDVLGLAIPLPRAYDYGGFAREGMAREEHHIQRWLEWLVHSVGMCREWANDPYHAPKYTHSCNRYFRPCSFIPFCYAPWDEQFHIVEQMEHDEWSPLNKEVLEGVGGE
jgi:hypothetical protein